MADLKVKYATAATLTITLASLADDNGRESTAIDNESNLYVDAHVGGFITTGTSPTNNTSIEVWAYASYDGTTYTGGATGSDAAFTPDTNEKMQLSLLTIINVDTTSNQKYEWGPRSIAAAFGGTMPRKWGIVVYNDTAVALNSTSGNHEVKYTGVHYQTV